MNLLALLHIIIYALQWTQKCIENIYVVYICTASFENELLFRLRWININMLIKGISNLLNFSCKQIDSLMKDVFSFPPQVISDGKSSLLMKL